MQSQKNTRRKRNDQQQRIFTCRCGKGYLSYAAAYTHVKQKHNLEKLYLDNIVKPERQKLPRGRPREKREAQISVEIEQLSVVDQAILKIYQNLQPHFQKVILEGNTKTNPPQIQQEFHKLIDRKLSASLKYKQKTSEFISELGKHFTSHISARIKLCVLLIQKTMGEGLDQSVEISRQIIRQLDGLDLWKGQDSTNQIILEAFLKWMRLLEQ